MKQLNYLVIMCLFIASQPLNAMNTSKKINNFIKKHATTKNFAKGMGIFGTGAFFTITYTDLIAKEYIAKQIISRNPESGPSTQEFVRATLKNAGYPENLYTSIKIKNSTNNPIPFFSYFNEMHVPLSDDIVSTALTNKDESDILSDNKEIETAHSRVKCISK